MSRISSKNPMLNDGTANPMANADDFPSLQKRRAHTGETPAQKLANKIGAAVLIGIMIILMIAAISYDVPESEFGTYAPTTSEED